MSRMYDALKHTESPVARMIEREQSSQPEAPAVETLLSRGEEFYERGQPEAPDEVATLLSLGEEICERGQPLPEPYVENPDGAVSEPVGEGGYRIVKLRVSATQPVLPFDGSDRRSAECYRVLRTNILHHTAQPKIIAVSSAGSGDGKTTSAINLAGVLALKQDVRVLLVDGDLRRGSVSPMLGIETSPGLAEVLTGECSLERAIVQTETLPNLHVLPAGRTSENPAELLDSAAWRELIEGLRGRFQYTIIDTTPIGVVTDYALIQEVCDGTIIVVRPEHTDRRACMKALQSVANGKLLGTVLNCTQDWFMWRAHADYGYYGKATENGTS